MNNAINILQMMQNPQQFLNQFMQNSPMAQNPMFKNAMDMYQKGDTKGLENLVNNVAQQKGTSVADVRKMLGI